MPHPAMLLLRQARRSTRDLILGWQSLSLSTSAPALADLSFWSLSTTEGEMQAAASTLAQQLHAKNPDKPPQLLQLLVRPCYPSTEIQNASKYLLDQIKHLYNLEAGSAQQPQLVGAVLSAVAGGQEFSTSGPMVSLLAAWLPGVHVHTFHATTPSLPSLPDGTWPKLIAAAASAQQHLHQGPWAPAAAGRGIATQPGSQTELHPPRSWMPERSLPTPNQSVLTLSAHGGKPSGQAISDGGPAVSPPGSGTAAVADHQGAGQISDAQQQRSGYGDNVGILMLSTPHFIQVEQLLQRLAGVLPGAQVVGGVSTPGAWSQMEKTHGCVYHGESAYQDGAVGVILHGRFALDTLVTPGFRPTGPVMEVTGAVGNVILELNGEPAHSMMQRALTDVLNGSESVGTSIKLGLDTSTAGLTTSSSSSTTPGTTGTTTSSTSVLGYPAPTPPPPAIPTSAAEPPADYPAPSITGASTDEQAAGFNSAGAGGLGGDQQAADAVPSMGSSAAAGEGEGQGAPSRTMVARSWGLAPSQRIPGIVVAVTQPIAAGTRVQLMVQDYQAAHRSVRTALKTYLSNYLTPAERAAPGSTAALLFSCSGIPFFEQPDIHMAVQGMQVAGGKVEGEFAAIHDPGAKNAASGASSSNLLHSYCSTVAFLRSQPGS